jgi:hypothetical protein
LVVAVAVSAGATAFADPAESPAIPIPRLNPALGGGDRASPAGAFDPGRIGFTATLRGELDVDYRVFAIFAEPGERIEIETTLPVGFAYDGDELDALSQRRTITAPTTPGHAPARLVAANGETLVLHVLIMTPASGGAVNGYALGEWPGEPYRGDPVYTAPTHFAQGSGDYGDIAVSPHFTLAQFLCKQAADGERYLVVSERLLLKLERVLEAVNAEGVRADTFTLLSGFRTPAYNAAIGNGRYSRHIYGGAADVFIDTDGDGWMDDLNGDGQITRADAARLYDLVERMAAQDNFAPYIGGLGEYGATSVRTPFVHIDERGWRARWGRPSTG